MAYNDTESNRWVQRIMAITFRIAKDLSPQTITRKWVARYLNRSEEFVKNNWLKNPYECQMNATPKSHYESLSQESKDVVTQCLGKSKKSVNEIVSLIEEVRGKRKDYHAVYRFLKSIKAKPFHQVTKPFKSVLNKEDRLSFIDILRDWDENDFLFLAPSDEFFIYTQRRANSQNDRIWALSIEDIEEEQHYKEVSKFPVVIGIFLMFTAKRLLWVIKDEGQKWDGDYFRTTVLSKNVIPFLKNPGNVLDAGQTTFLHDKAPCMKAIATQQLLKSNNIDFFDNTQWPGSSPDLNMCECMGAILKSRVEKNLEKLNRYERNTKDALMTALNEELARLEFDTTLFRALLVAYPERLAAVRKANGGQTEF